MTDYHLLDIAHTLKQIDNRPCPKLITRYVQMFKAGCTSRFARCEEREVWVCDHFGSRQGDFTFLETPDFRAKCLENGEFDRKHVCGMGTSVHGLWRHLDRASTFSLEKVGYNADQE